MKKWFKDNKFLVAGIMIGGVAGFSYWYFWGCSNDRCMLKSNPYYMTAYGTLLGGLFFTLLKKQ